VQSEKILSVPHSFCIDNHLAGFNLLHEVPSQALQVLRSRFNGHHQFGAGFESFGCEDADICPTIQHDVPWSYEMRRRAINPPLLFSEVEGQDEVTSFRNPILAL